MENRYSSDPKYSSSSDVASSAQSESGGAKSEAPFSSAPASQFVSGPDVVKHARLSAGVVLSAGRYRIERLVASGGMGAVYRAIDTRFNRPCAVKEMLDDFTSEADRSQAVDWFSREATLLLDLNHPCIPRVRDFFAENSRHYLVMDFIEGHTLAEIMAREGTVPGLNGAHGVTEARARNWAQQICSVLAYLHRQTPPIVFRDLKPSNVMLTEQDEIKLIDFGIARTFQSQKQSTIIMTPGYAPPEQLYGRAEPRSDIYALGATLHKVLTFHDASNNQPTLFSFPPVRTLRPDVSAAFEQVIMKALQPDMAQRWSSAQEMERALQGLPPVTATPLLGGVPSQVAAAAQPQTPYASGVAPAMGSGPASKSTTGPAGPHILAAQGHLKANPTRVEAAYEAVKVAFGYEPNNAQVHKLFGQVFARRVPPQPDQALQAYNRSLQLYSGDAEIYKLIGDLYLFVYQRPSEGIFPYTQSLRLEPNDFETHQRLAMCYERTNQLEAALREYQEATRLAGKNPALFFALGQLAMRLRRLPIAEHAFIQVLFINPGDHQTRFLLAQVYEQENKLDEALRECSYVSGPLHTNPAVQQMYQRLRVRLGR
jgi:serine/threonine protein kinase